mgnify:CR=1 FL=1
MNVGLRITCSLIKIFGVLGWIFVDVVIGGLVVIIGEVVSWLEYTDWSGEIE